jgi:uncharacterized membrane protein YtjA (UPF0391 family)
VAAPWFRLFAGSGATGRLVLKISLTSLILGGIAGFFGFTGMAGDWSEVLKGVMIAACSVTVCASGYDIVRLTPLRMDDAARRDSSARAAFRR